MRLAAVLACVATAALAADPGVVAADDAERPFGLDGGPWTQSFDNECATAAAGGSSIGPAAACAHRGDAGLRFVDNVSNASAGCEAPLSADNFPPFQGSATFRAWMRLDAANGGTFLAIASLHRFGSPPAASFNLATDVSPPTVHVSGFDRLQVASQEGSSQVFTLAAWHLVELQLEGVGTSAGVRRSYLDGVQLTTRSGLDLMGSNTALMITGFTYADPRSFTGTLCVDDVRLGTRLSASHLRLTGPSTPGVGRCTPVRADFLDSSDAGAPLGATTAFTASSAAGVFVDLACAQPFGTVVLDAGADGFDLFVRPTAAGPGQLLLQGDDLLASPPLAFVAVDAGPLTDDGGADAGPDAGAADAGRDAGSSDGGADAGESDGGRDAGSPDVLWETAPSSATCGVPYRLSSTGRVLVSGSGPWTFRTEGTTPPGLTLDAQTGFLDWTPTAGGHYAFDVVAQSGALTRRGHLDVAVTCDPKPGCGCDAGAPALLPLLALAAWAQRRKSRTARA